MITTMMSSWTKYSLLFLALVLSSSSRSHGLPLDIVLIEGQNATIECLFDVPVFDCDWIKDGCCELKLNGSRYAVIGNLEDGNCTLAISNVHKSDEGYWQCESTVRSSGPILKSTRARIKIGLQSNGHSIDTDYSRKIEKHPQSQSVVQHEQLILECEFNGTAQDCFWMKDGDLITIEDKYQYIGEPDRGNCSIKITRMELEDVGLWQCGYPRVRKTASLKSKVANVTIGVAPDDPVIVYNGIRTKNGEMLYVDTNNALISVWCYSENGNPPATLKWTLDGRSMTKPVITQTFTNRLYQSIWISRSIFMSQMPSSWNQMHLICEAEHPLYSQSVKRVQVQLTIPESDHPNSNRQRIDVYGRPIETGHPQKTFN